MVEDKSVTEIDRDELSVVDVINERRSELNIQNFMDDMRMLGEQLLSKDIAKPPFNFGDLGVTNYLLWLLLGEIMQLNDEVRDA